MSKKILSLISILFLVSFLAISCSNADKTGSGDNNSGNGGSSTGDGGTGDGGTTPTPQPDGIAKYAGTWILKETTTGSGGGTMIIAEDGSVNLKELTLNSTDVTDKGNETYDIVFTITESTVTLTLNFTSDTTGSYEAKLTDGTQHIGTLTKQ